MTTGSRWISIVGRLYYIVGLLYYLYNWLIVLGVGGLIASGAVYVHHPYLAATILPTSFCVLMVGTVILLKRKSIRLQSANPGLRELTLDSTYVIQNGHSCQYLRKVRLKCLADGVSSYQHKFRWTGDGDVYPLSVQGRHRLELSKEKYGSRTCCTVILERPLRMREEVELEYTLRLTSNGHPPKPFLSHTVYFPINKLVQSVQFNNDIPLKYKRQIFASATADIPVYEDNVDVFAGSHTLTYEVKEPRMFYRYSICW